MGFIFMNKVVLQFKARFEENHLNKVFSLPLGMTDKYIISYKYKLNQILKENQSFHLS